MWSYAPSPDNPTNLLTSGVLTQQLSSELWLHNPRWLPNELNWPTWVPTSIIHLQTTKDLDPEPLTPSHLLYGRRIQSVPHPLDDPEEIEDLTYISGDSVRKQADRHGQLIRHFWSRWKKEYLTSLREFNKLKVSESDKQIIRKGDVVIIHDDKPRLYWKLAIVENLIKGNDGLV